MKAISPFYRPMWKSRATKWSRGVRGALVALVPAGALLVTSCNPESATEAKKEGKELVDKAVAVLAEPEVPKLSAGERASMLGIAAHLSKDTESVLALYDLQGALKDLRGLKTWKHVAEIAAEETGEDIDAQMDASIEEPMKFVGQELFIATGKGTATQVDSLARLNELQTYHTFRLLISTLLKARSDDGGMSALEGLEGIDTAPYYEILKDLDAEFGRIEKAEFPPTLVGAKIPDEAARQQAEEALTSSLEFLPSMLGEGAEPVEFTKAGGSFKGYKLNGEFFAKQLEESGGEIPEVDAKNRERLIEVLKTKTVVIASGVKGDYLMAYVGTNEEACPLVDNVEESLAATDKVSFVDGHAGKKVFGLMYGDEELMKLGIRPSFKPMVDGVKDGLSSVDGLIGVENLTAMMDLVGEKELAVLKFASAKTLGGTIVVDQGLQFNLYDGLIQGSIDYDTPLQLAKLGGEGSLIQAHWRSNPEHVKASGEFAEAVVEAIYESAKVVLSKTEDSSPSEMKEAAAGLQMFEQNFREDLLMLWSGLSTSSAAMGNEVAVVMDVQGAMPAFPGIPQELVDEAKFPRLSVVVPVTERAKLAEGWKLLDGGLRSLLKKAGEMQGSEIPMQKPITSERNGMINYSFPIPFTSDDFNPSVTVGDRWFVATTSKLQAFDLAAAADSAAGTETGAWAKVDLDALRLYVKEWIALGKKHQEVLFPEESSREEFLSDLPKIEKALEISEEFSAIEFRSQREAGRVRHTLHFKMR